MSEQPIQQDDNGVEFFKALAFGMLFGVVIPCAVIFGVCKLIKMVKGL